MSGKLVFRSVKSASEILTFLCRVSSSCTARTSESWSKVGVDNIRVIRRASFYTSTQLLPLLVPTTTQPFSLLQRTQSNGTNGHLAMAEELARKKLKIEGCAANEDDPANFEKVFHQLVDEVIEEDEANPEIADAARRFKKMLHYTVPGGKRNRGLTVINAFRLLAKPDQLTDDNVFKAMMLGWCVELLQAFFLIADDMMDQSKTRRGQPCWYRQPDISMDAINDSFYVEQCLYKFLKKHIRGQPYYTNVIELFHETTYQTVIGQSLDLITSPESNRDLKRFTQQRYDAIVKWKTAFYSFYLPVALAMYMVGIEDELVHQNAKTILLTMGHFFQVQDDYLDCYGEPSVIGKIGTDIEENKCGWLVVQALQRVSAEQRQIIEENYGIDDPSKVAKIKELYRELDLSTVYKDYEEQSYQDLMKLIDLHSGSLPKEMFVAYAKRIYKRKK